VPMLKPPLKQPKTTTLQVRLEEGVRTNLDEYGEFIDATPSYVVSESLKFLFRRDGEFKIWLDQRRTATNRQQLGGVTCPQFPHTS